MASLKGIIETIAGAAMIAVGILLPGPWSPYLISAGSGMVLSGVGTLIIGEHDKGFATTMRNPIAPWKIIYGRARTGGVLVYMNMWGDNAKMLDMVIILAAHKCQGGDTANSLPVLLFDQQRIQIDTNACAPGAIGGTSFTPVQQKVVVHSIKRVNGVVTVVLNTDIPYLSPGDQFLVSDMPRDTPPGSHGDLGLTLNGKWQVAEIISRVPSGGTNILTFTFLSGGLDVGPIIDAGYVHTLWADYGRKVYMEILHGDQALGETFKGMTYGTPYDGDMGNPALMVVTGAGSNWVGPDRPAGLGSGIAAAPNPWTKYCSLQGKTAVFLRLHYNNTYFAAGLPQISFVLHGKNDIQLNPGISLPVYGYTENAVLCIADFLTQKTWGYKLDFSTDIPIDPLNAGAAICDQAVPLQAGGTEPRYTCNGQFDLSMKRGEILQNMLTSCAGRITTTDGQWIIQPGYWAGPSSPPVALDLMAIAAGEFHWRPMPTIRDLFNGVKGTYISPENKWQSADFPYYAQDSLHGYRGPSEYGGDINLAADGGERRWFDINLPFTISSSMAQRIAKIELLRRRHFGIGTFTCNLTAYQLVPLDVPLATHSYLGWTNKELEVQATRFTMASPGEGRAPVLAVEIDVQETDSDIYVWDTDEELTPQGYQQGTMPVETVVELVPYPWSSGYAAPLDGDATYPEGHIGPGFFGVETVYGTNQDGSPALTLAIKGALPINKLDKGIYGPQITAVANSSGGNLGPGTYIIGLSAHDAGAAPYKCSDYLDYALVTIPEESPPNPYYSITVNINWSSGDDGGDLYVALQQLTPQQGGQLIAAKQYDSRPVFHFNQTVGGGSATATITEFDASTPGGPDADFDHFGVVWQRIVHGGIWAAQVQAVTATTVTLASLVAGDVSADQWSGYVLSLLAKYKLAVEVAMLNLPVASNTASSGAPAEFVCTIGPNANGATLPALDGSDHSPPAPLLEMGDLLVMRGAYTFTDTSFTDPNVANMYYPDGASGVEAGHLAVVLTGPDAGDVQTIANVTQGDGVTPGPPFIRFNLTDSWQVTPNAGDLVIIVLPSSMPEYTTPPVSTTYRGAVTNPVVAQPVVQNLGGGTWLFRVRTEMADGSHVPDFLAPFREVYIFGAQGTRTIIADDTMLPTDSLVNAYAQTANVTYTCLPFAEIPNQLFEVVKADTTANTVTVQTDPAVSPRDTFDDGSTSYTLISVGDTFTFRVHGNG